MSFVSNVTKRGLAATNSTAPKTYIDILYDFAGYLSLNGSIGSGSLAGRSIGIVGSGAAGLIAAYQLMQLGAQVTILEAGNRAGGRLYTQYPIPGEPAAFEMGAMRVPPCEQLFNYYCGLFNILPGGQFPDPGKVDTQIIYRNTPYNWPAGGNPPAIFDNVTTGWNALAGKLSQLSTLLISATPADLANAQQQWQALVYVAIGFGPEQGYSTISFYQGLVQAFVENYADYGLSVPWTADDFELFGALGVGSGGFGPLYSVNFAEIARLIINGLESDQQFYPGGIVSLVDGFLNATPDPNRPTLQLGSCILFGQQVYQVQNNRTPPLPVHVLTNSDAFQFDAVIVATTNRAMQVDMNLTDGADQILPQAVSSAVRQLHLMNSSKLFVLTQTKFWQANGSTLPSNIQSDTLVRGLYCLDYYPQTPGVGYGVVLISYTWGDDSTKLLAINNPIERLEICLRSIENTQPDFVAALRAELIPELTQMIDWQLEPNYYGAFKLNQPGQDAYNQRLYSHFLSANGVYLAGDSVGWCGGWIESALQTGMNAASAVVQQFLGRDALYPGSPMTQQPALYQYGPNLALRAKTG
jgi:tryptophan 2-monooxygenase